MGFVGQGDQPLSVGGAAPGRGVPRVSVFCSVHVTSPRSSEGVKAMQLPGSSSRERLSIILSQIREFLKKDRAIKGRGGEGEVVEGTRVSLPPLSACVPTQSPVRRQERVGNGRTRPPVRQAAVGRGRRRVRQGCVTATWGRGEGGRKEKGLAVGKPEGCSHRGLRTL